MPKGLKGTSSTIAVGFSVTETAINTFTQEAVDLNLDPLNREVFVVMAIDLDPTAPDCIVNTNTATSCSLTTTSQTAVQSLANSNCLSNAVLNIRSNAVQAVPFQRAARESPSSLLEYLGIIATNDFFIQINGNNNTLVKSCSGKLYGYRAQASAEIYAALVQSEVLSA